MVQNVKLTLVSDLHGLGDVEIIVLWDSQYSEYLVKVIHNDVCSGQRITLTMSASDNEELAFTEAYRLLDASSALLA